MLQTAGKPFLIFRPYGLLVLVTATFGLILPALAQPGVQPSEIRLRSNFSPNPLERSGTSGGSLPVINVIAQRQTPTGPCLGYISPTPNHILTLENFFNNLAIAIDSDVDTTLVVQGPGGVWCNDDTMGHNPAIIGQWQQGSYRIWVGSYSRAKAHPYQLIIHADPP